MVVDEHYLITIALQQLTFIYSPVSVGKYTLNVLSSDAVFRDLKIKLKS